MVRKLLHPFQSFFTVVTVQIVQIDDVDQPVGIARIGGITGFLQTTGPSFIVCNLQTEKRRIACPGPQELGMVAVRILGMAVSPETLVRRIVVGTHRPPVPAPSALDTEMIVRLAGQFAPPGTRLQQSLSQRDTGRNVIPLHLLHRSLPILPDVILIRFVPPLGPQRKHHPRQTEHENIS